VVSVVNRLRFWRSAFRFLAVARYFSLPLFRICGLRSFIFNGCREFFLLRWSPEREMYYVPPYSAEAKKAWAYTRTSIPSACFHILAREDFTWHNSDKFDVYVTVHRDKFLIIKLTRCTNFSNLFLNETLHVSDSSSVHHQEFFTVHTAMVYVIQVCWHLTSRIRIEHPDPACKLSANLYDVYHWCVYNEKRLMVDRGTARNM
jgi:hypothetical protein